MPRWLLALRGGLHRRLSRSDLRGRQRRHREHAGQGAPPGQHGGDPVERAVGRLDVGVGRSGPDLSTRNGSARRPSVLMPLNAVVASARAAGRYPAARPARPQRRGAARTLVGTGPGASRERATRARELVVAGAEGGPDRRLGCRLGRRRRLRTAIAGRRRLAHSASSRRRRRPHLALLRRPFVCALAPGACGRRHPLDRRRELVRARRRRWAPGPAGAVIRARWSAAGEVSAARSASTRLRAASASPGGNSTRHEVERRRPPARDRRTPTGRRSWRAACVWSARSARPRP